MTTTLCYSPPENLASVALLAGQVLEELLRVETKVRLEWTDFEPTYIVPDANLTIPTISLPENTIIPAVEHSAEIIRKINEAVLNPEFRDEDEPAPAAHAVNTAKELIDRSRPLLRGFRFRATVRPFHGSVRITWASDRGNIRLVCNPHPAESYIYHERIGRRHSIDYGSEKATHLALAKWLRWLERMSA